MDRATVLSTDAGPIEEVALRGTRSPLIGVATLPARVTGPGLILFNAGMLHRVGPNRLYVKLARYLARRGYPTLRFDMSALGDSPPRRDHPTVTVDEARPADGPPPPTFADFGVRTREEAQWAMAELRRLSGCTDFVVGGLCFGAVCGLQVAQFEPAVRGVIMLNPQFIDDDDLTAYVEARNRQYWRRVLTNWERWRGLFIGHGDYRMIAQRLRGLFVRQKNVDKVADRILAQYGLLFERKVRLFQAFSAADVGLDYLELILRDRSAVWQADGRLTLVTLDGCDHLFTPLASQARLLQACETWLAAAQPVASANR